jgi:hypothetical protein
VALDVARVVAEDARRGYLVQVALDRVEMQGGLAEADDALVGHELDPAQGGPVRQADGPQLDEAHQTPMGRGRSETW